MELRWLAHIFACTLVLFGCSTSQLRPELDSFKSSLADANKSGDLLYDEIATVIGAPEGRSACGSDRSGVPKCFNPDAVGYNSSGNEDASISARRLALEVVTEYSVVLAEVVGGQSSDDSRGNVQNLVAAASGLALIAGSAIPATIPVLLSGPAVGAVESLAVQLERARTTAKVRQILISQEATVSLLIDRLIADTAQMYEIYYRSRVVQTLRLPGLQAEQEMRKAANYHAALTAYVNLLRKAKLSHQRLVAIARTPVSSTADLRTAVEEAAQVRTAADTLWKAIRQVRQ